MDVRKDKPGEILEQIKDIRAAQNIENVDEEHVKLVVFSIASNRYAFRSDGIKEILIPTEISFVPGAPDYIAGVINVRGYIESVILMNRIMGLPELKESTRARILLASHEVASTGILVESVEDVLDVPVSLIKQAPSTIDAGRLEFISGEVMLKDGNATLLNLETLLRKLL
jgi:purine-binding chemotaxis protein CheW